MGTNYAAAMLVYGITIHNPYKHDADWWTEDTDDDLPWYDPDNDDFDFGDQAINHILATTGHIPEHALDRDRVTGQLPVHMVAYGHDNEPCWILATHTFTTYGAEHGHHLRIDPAWLAEQADNGEWDTHLIEAMDILGVVPHNPAPGWHLVTHHHH